VWVELKGSWHELKYHVTHKAGVDYVFAEHIAFERPGTPYGDIKGPFQDNLFRCARLCCVCVCVCVCVCTSVAACGCATLHGFVVLCKACTLPRV
jgi:hypothetical protein